MLIKIANNFLLKAVKNATWFNQII